MNVNKAFSKALYSYKKKTGDDWELAGKSLVEFVSFRYSTTKNNFFSVLFFILKDVTFNIFNSEKINTYKKLQYDSRIIILDNSLRLIDLRKNYLYSEFGIEPDALFCKSNLIIVENFVEKIQLLSLSLFWSFKLLFVKKEKQFFSNYALIIKELVETICFLKFLKKLNAIKVYDFANYEIDSNLLYLILKQNNIEVCKIPSAGPLENHNSILLTDELVVSSGYHLEELDYLKNIKYSSLIKAMPEMAGQFINKYNEIVCEPSGENKYSIGYYSHGSWLRAKRKHSDNGLNILKGEEEALKIISSFFSKNDKFKLYIFLHPKEKHADVLSETQAYYKSILNECSFEFAPFDLKSTENFSFVNIAIVSLSTILFERLFVGKKILICKKDLANFPHPKSKLNSICFEDDIQFEKLVMNNYLKSDVDFFLSNNLETHLRTNFIS